LEVVLNCSLAKYLLFCSSSLKSQLAFCHSFFWLQFI
jgi:hypothetical protein